MPFIRHFMPFMGKMIDLVCRDLLFRDSAYSNSKTQMLTGRD